MKVFLPKKGKEEYDAPWSRYASQSVSTHTHTHTHTRVDSHSQGSPNRVNSYQGDWRGIRKHCFASRVPESAEKQPLRADALQSYRESR